MSESESGASTVTGSAQADNVTTQGDQAQSSSESAEAKAEKERVVSYSDHKRAIDDMLKYKRELEETRKKISEAEAQALREKEDYKTLSERLQAERDEALQNLESERGTWQQDMKYRAVKEEAIKAGLRNERDLELFNLDDVKLEYTTEGRVLVQGTKDFVEQLKKDRPYLFQDSRVPRFNGGGASGATPTTESLTPAKFVELERKYKREGDKTKLAELHKTYLKQRQA